MLPTRPLLTRACPIQQSRQPHSPTSTITTRTLHPLTQRIQPRRYQPRIRTASLHLMWSQVCIHGCTMISGFHRANRVWDLMSVADSSDQAVLSELLASWFQTGYHTGYYKVCTHHCHCVRITADVGCCIISHHSPWCHCLCLDAGAVRFASCSTRCCDAQHILHHRGTTLLLRHHSRTRNRFKHHGTQPRLRRCMYHILLLITIISRSIL